MTLPGSVQVSENWNVTYPSPASQLTENYDVEYTLDSGSGGSASGVSASEHVFVSGTGVTLGTAGDHSFVREAGTQISDTDAESSPFVFESGSGVDLGGETDANFDKEGTVNEGWNIDYSIVTDTTLQYSEGWNVNYPSPGLQVTKDWED